MLVDLILFAITGSVAGTLAGLLGIGGGMIVVPCLVYIFTYIGMPEASMMHAASATSLSAMIFTSSVSAYSHYKREAVLWPVVKKLLPGIVTGTILGMLLASLLSTAVLKIIFGIFLLFIAFRMFVSFKPKPSRELPGPLGSFGVASLIGGKSGLLGVGGGALMVPFFTYCNISIREAAGTSAACGFPIALVGTLSAIATGWHHDPGDFYTFGYVYWPATLAVALFSMVFVFLGAKLSKIMPVTIIRKIFACVLVLAALDLLI